MTTLFKDKIKALMLALITQTFFLALFFVGGLLDPLIALGIGAAYFALVGTALSYHFLLSCLIKGQQ